MTEGQATFIGSSALLLWGALALLSVYAQEVPPLQLITITFSIAFLLFVLKWRASKVEALDLLYQNWPMILFGATGLFLYHFLYFLAFQYAPAIEASLIAYLWPVLIVVFSMFLPDHPWRWAPVAGAFVGLFGCALLVGQGRLFSFQIDYWQGYAAAFGCALTWSSYSVLSRYRKTTPTDSVGWYCAGAALLGLSGHFIFEETVWPISTTGIIGVIALGLGPVGIAFLTWDIGMKQGNISLLGTLSYGAPLLSTALLLILGETVFTATIGWATIAITSGAIIAAWDTLKQGLKPSR